MLNYGSLYSLQPASVSPLIIITEEMLKCPATVYSNALLASYDGSFLLSPQLGTKRLFLQIERSRLVPEHERRGHVHPIAHPHFGQFNEWYTTQILYQQQNGELTEAVAFRCALTARLQERLDGSVVAESGVHVQTDVTKIIL